MKIYLVRHGETEGNNSGLVNGQAGNYQLNQMGVMQANALKNKLKDINFTVCFTSPLIRAWSTAIILVGDRVEIKEDARIMERYLGELEGKDKELYDIDKYNDYKLNSNDNGVEPIQDLFTRCNSFLDYLKENYNDDDTILVVSHYGCIRTMHHILEKTDHNKISDDIKIENCFCRCYEL